jgi:hypothetical protein
MQLLAQVAGVRLHGGLSKLKSNSDILYIIPPRASAARGGLRLSLYYFVYSLYQSAVFCDSVAIDTDY